MSGHKKWSQEKSTLFVDNVTNSDVTELFYLLDKCTVVTARDVINTAVNRITDIFNSAARKSFGFKRSQHFRNNSKPWFNKDCLERRKKFHNAKRIYLKNRTDNSKENLNVASKNLMHEFIKTYIIIALCNKKKGIKKERKEKEKKKKGKKALQIHASVIMFDDDTFLPKLHNERDNYRIDTVFLVYQSICNTQLFCFR
ncbi:hypothetical protein KUTeg_007711 [Tegillarca granosa]|uniref:Uncharacterized protein n=1 Tax=Tegillarca granosa TaxID=220873 RepID=A0ABQ9FE28_TEGGR|nr:hypothetical protein KUTeg_007711 [Tegillarca granosa]